MEKAVHIPLVFTAMVFLLNIKKSVGDAKPKPEMSVIIILANALILQVRKLCLKILCDAKKGEIFLEITFND